MIQANSIRSVISGGAHNLAAGFYSSIVGGISNQATGPGAFVGGGGADGVNFGGNTASGADSTVGGGYGNQANGTGAFVGGDGFDGSSHNANAANGLATTLAGGLGNTSEGDYSTTGGGDGNYCNGTLFGGATIGGGIFNTNYYDCGTIGGGFYNVVNNLYATVPGGYHNTANGEGSLAAGESATANDSDSFVWGDGSRAALSQGADTFTVLATGEAYFYTTVSGVNVAVDNHADLDFGTTTRQMINLYSTTYGIGVQSSDEYFRTAGQYYWYLNGSHNDANGNSGGGATLMSLSTSGLTVNGTFVSASDRNLKEHFQAVDALQTLARVSALPITRKRGHTIV